MSNMNVLTIGSLRWGLFVLINARTDGNNFSLKISHISVFWDSLTQGGKTNFKLLAGAKAV